MHFYSGLDFVIAILDFSLGVYILVKNPKAPLNRVFFWLTCCFASWALADVFYHTPDASLETALLATNLAAPGWLFFGSFGLWFMLIFAEQESVLRSKYTLAILFCPPIILLYQQWMHGSVVGSSLQPDGWSPVWQGTLWSYLFIVYYTSYICIGLAALVSFWRKTEDDLKKRQVRIIFAAAAFTLFFASLSNVWLPMLGIHELSSILHFFLFFWTCGVAVSIAKYKFLTITPATAADNIIATMTDALILLNPKGEIVTVNDSALEMLGCQADDLMGQSFASVYAHGIGTEDITHRLMTTDAIANLEVHLKKISGTTVPVMLSSTLLKDERKRLAGIVCVVRDISERIQMENELRRVEKLESIGTLAGGIAHDFNNLIAGILGNIEIALLHLDPEESHYGNLNNAVKGCIRARDLCRQFITFSKGGDPIKTSSPVSKLLKEASQMALMELNAQCDISIAPDLWPVKYDAVQMKQALSSLITNAGEAMPHGGCVRIRATNERTRTAQLPLPAGDYVCIEIQDDGRGIPQKLLPLIFDPYFSTKQRGATRGTGWGLSSAYLIVQKHGGTVTVTSTPNIGTRFRLFLPALRPSNTQKTRRPQPQAVGAGVQQQP